MLSILLTAALAAPAFPDDKKETPAKLELFAKEDWYKGQKEKEEDFVGVVEKAAGGGGIGFGRFNPYRLVMGEGKDKKVREIYVGGKKDVLDGYVGKKVKITGKPVDMEVEGKVHNEIWPARLEIVAEKKEEKKGEAKPALAVRAVAADEMDLKVTASAPWPGKVNGAGLELVIRTAEELAVARGMAADKAKEEETQKKVTADLAKLLKVDAIDWKKQMVIVVTAGTKNSGGYKVAVAGVNAKGDAVTVKWTVKPPEGFATAAITHPGVVALVDRHEGKVTFDPPAPKGK